MEFVFLFVVDLFQHNKNSSSEGEIVQALKRMQMFRRKALTPFSWWNYTGQGKHSAYV
jgi:hypothetical protein